MPRRKKHQAEEIIRKLRTAEVEFARGKTVLEACKLIGVTEQTYYRWKKPSRLEYAAGVSGSTKRSGLRSWKRRTPS